MNNFNKLTPFKWFVLENFPFIEEDFDAITNYQLLCKVVAYLNKIKAKTNELGIKVEELNNWFNNLDVQEEINNKIDEMIESGQFQEILEEILNQIKNYKTVIEMKEDLQIQENTIVFCSGYNNINQDYKSYFYISNSGINNNITTIELDNGLFANLIYTNKIKVFDNSLLNETIVNNLLNNGISIITNEPIPVNYNITITNDNIEIKNMKFQGQEDFSGYIISLRGKNQKVKNCYFTGDAGQYIQAHSTTNATISNNIFDMTNVLKVTHPVNVRFSNNVIVKDNKFYNSCGFNIQTYNTKRTLITDNEFKNGYLKGRLVVGEVGNTFIIPTEGTLEYINTISLQTLIERIHRRHSVKINGIETTDYNITAISENSVTITFNENLNVSDVITYRAYKSLENININYNSYDVTITNNILNGTGDSSIVIGSDYHNGELSQNVDYYDMPRRIVITNNIISNCAGAGIVTNANINDVIISNNNISNCGWNVSEILNSSANYSSCIYVNPSGNLSITNNICSNINSSDGINEEETGVTQFGIFYGSITSTLNNENVLYWKNIIKNNVFMNLKRDFFAPQGLINTLNSLPYTDLPYTETETFTGDTQNDYTISGEQTTKVDSASGFVTGNAVRYNYTEEQSYTDIELKTINSFAGSTGIEFIFGARTTGNLVKAQIISGNNEYSIDISSSYKIYRLGFINNNSSSKIKLRFKKDENVETASVLISKLKAKIYNINNNTIIENPYK